MNLPFVREVGVLNWLCRVAMRQWFKRVVRREHAIQLPTGGRFRLPIESFFATQVFVTRADVDWGSDALLARLLANGSSGCLLDVGANIGYYAAYFAPLVTAVYAFEPDDRPRRTLERHSADYSNVHVVPRAVGPQSGTARFSRSAASEVSHLAQADEESVEVEVVALDDFVAAYGLNVAAIKTDVEGFDLQVLDGAKTILSEQRPIILSELQPDASVSEFTTALGYAVFAYARDRRTRACSFVSVESGGSARLDYKMLFLLPSERVPEVLMLTEVG